MLSKVLTYIVLLLLVALASSGFYIASLRSENEDLNTKLLTIKVSSEQKKARYDRDTAAFDYAMKEVVKFYEGTISDIKSFKKGANETDCQAANRLLNRFGR